MSTINTFGAIDKNWPVACHLYHPDYESEPMERYIAITPEEVADHQHAKHIYYTSQQTWERVREDNNILNS